MIGEPPQVQLDRRGNTKSPSHKSADLQFARFLEAAERLGSSLDRYFDDLFVSIVLAPACLAAEQPGGMSISSRGSSQSAAEIEPAIKRKKSLSPKLPHLSLADGLDAPILVRLHFTEAMMVLLFNTLDAAQQKDSEARLRRSIEARRELGNSGDASRHASGVPRGLERDAEHAGEQSSA